MTNTAVAETIPPANDRPNFNSRSGDMTAATALMGAIISMINMEEIIRNNNMMSNRNGTRKN